MGKRREGREAAVQFLFQADFNAEDIENLLADFWQLREAKQSVRQFATELVHGIWKHRAQIDELIRKATANYEFARIAAVDRNILRVAVYEMLYANDVPPVVSINEGIEIAKRFGAEESGRFVNGILDRIRHEIPRPAREAAGS